MIKVRAVSAFFVAIGVLTASIMAEPSKNFKVFLCFGQSNMSGGNGVTPDADSKKTNPRIKVLAFADCSSPSRKTNTWSDACEPMHCGDGMNMMGPSYEFGKAIADSLPNDTIGLIPCGQWGVSIDYFVKGGSYTGTKPSTPGGTNVYQWMLTKCKEAQKRGVFSGIILHQGESNSGQSDWPTKVKKIVDDLKTDCGISGDIPLVAGELLYSGCCKGHNSVIATLPQKLPNSFVASSEGQSGVDQYHFNQAGYRTIGKRMAVEMVKGLKVYEKVATSQPKPQRFMTSMNVSANQSTSKVYSLDGRFIATASALNSKKALRPGNLYIIHNEETGVKTNLVIAPAAR